MIIIIIISSIYVLSAPSEAPFPVSPVPQEEYIFEGSDHVVLKGAKKFLDRPFQYDFSMGYYTVSYQDSVNTGKMVYPGGDIDPKIGVCTDLIVRVYREAGYDLQKLVYEDANHNFSSYPYSIWNMTKPNPNIDHRRVPMLNAFFKRHGKSLTIKTDNEHLTEWKAGDIVVWDLTGRGKLDHIGIVSDKRLKSANRPLVIDNFPDPGCVAETDRLEEWTIRAHYRYPK
jgi:uncharacterized protein